MIRKYIVKLFMKRECGAKFINYSLNNSKK